MFLYASFNAPHLPNEAPPEAIARYSHIGNPYRRIHAAMVSELDAAIGRLVDALKAERMLEDTLIWFMSDNGGLNPGAVEPALRNMSKRLEGWFGKPLPLTALEFVRTNSLEGGADNRPYRKGKQSVYEGGVRVPSLIHWQNRVAPRRISKMVTAQDVLPTLLGATGLKDTAEYDGADQWPSMERDAAAPTPDYVTQGLDGVAFYRFPWKLVRLGSDQVELYQVDEDPTERVDRAAAEPSVVEELANALSAFPRGTSINRPLWKLVWDPDFFGGEEDREPWADTVNRDANGR
jgi:arylsulfatase A-like enzyme